MSSPSRCRVKGECLHENVQRQQITGKVLYIIGNIYCFNVMLELNLLFTVFKCSLQLLRYLHY